MDSVEKVVVGIALTLFGGSIALLFVLLQASAQLTDQYKQSCTERNGVTVYNGRHYECFVK